MRNKKLPTKMLGIVCLLILAGCGGNSSQLANSPPPPPTGVSVSPSSVTVSAGGVQQFTATVSPSGANQAVTWSVSGTGCTGASCGTIDATGKYTAPATAPNPPTVTVRAASVADSAKAAIAAANIITAVNNSIPAITTISPTSAAAGGAAFTLTVNGSNFVTGSVVRWNGSDRPTAFISASQVSAQIPASDIAVAGTAAITVFNPAPGEGASNSLTFTITGPTITTISPNSADTGGAAFTLTVNGSNFLTGSVVNFAGVARATTFVSPSQLTAAIPAAAITTARIAAVTVTNPAPSGGASNPVNFTIGRFLPRFAYVANGNSNDVSMYTINATTGALTAIAPGTIAAGRFPQAVAVDPSGRFAYVATLEFDAVSMYTINATTGALTSIGTTVTAGGSAQSVAVDPSGRFAYVASADNDFGFSSLVSMFTINATTGVLTSIGAIDAGITPASVAVDPSGRFAYAASNAFSVGETGNVFMYTINATTGALTSIGTIAAGIDPASVAVDPSGRFAYVANAELFGGVRGTGNVSMYTIDVTTGALTSIGTIAAGSNPVSVAVDASGKFAYVANLNSNDVSMYTIDVTTGALTSIGTIAAGSNPVSVAVDASGKFAYVANGDSNSVSMYTIDVTTGTLTSIGTIAAGTLPRSVAITGIIQ
jgi:6-phosphogluconolactonase